MSGVGCGLPADWAGLGFALAGACALVAAALAGVQSMSARVAAVVPAGLLSGFFLLPSASAVVSLVVAALALGDAPRRYILIASLLFVVAGLAGNQLMQMLAGPYQATTGSC